MRKAFERSDRACSVYKGTSQGQLPDSRVKGILLGTPNREPQEYSRYIIGIYLPGSLYSIIFLLYSWGSLFGVPSRVPLRVSHGYPKVHLYHLII